MGALFLAPQPFFQSRGMCLAQAQALEELAALGAEVEVLALPGGRDISLPAAVRVRRLPALPLLTGLRQTV